LPGSASKSRRCLPVRFPLANSATRSIGAVPACATSSPPSAIRVGDEKLVKIWKTGALELYDLKADPGERTDLASRRPERVRVLHDQLMAYFKRMDAEVLHGYGQAKEEN
jgi:hypothetical protein